MNAGKWRRGVSAGCVLAGALFLAGPVPGAAAPPEGRVVVSPTATVDGEAIRLGDIASLAGTAAELARLDIQPAPKPGTTLSVSGAAILERLRAQVDLERVRYVIPPLVRVRRRAQEVPAAAVRALVEEYVGHQLEALGGRALLRIVEVPGPVRLAPGPYDTRVNAARQGPLTGRTRIAVDFVQNDVVVETVTATAHVEVFEEVYVARRAIPRGTILGPDDLLAERRAAAALPRGAVLRAADAIGMEARAPISALTPLRHDQLGAPVLVRRGDIVTLVAESGALRITTKGEVREDAARASQVRVWNLGSRREVIGRVVDGKTVVVPF
jgi:flagella basal body P-ring formation protein FlgA